jgi:hypothetical protein
MSRIYKKHIFLWLAYSLITMPIALLYSQQSEEAISQPEEEEISFEEPELEQIEKLTIAPIVSREIGKPVPVGLTFNIPILGGITIYTEKDPETEENMLRGTFASGSKKIDLSPIPITIDEGTITLRKGNRVSVGGRATAFGHAARLSLEEFRKSSPVEAEAVPGTEAKKLSFSIDLARFRLTFIDKPTVTILPGQSLELSTIDLTIEKDKPTSITSKVLLFNQEITINFSFGKQEVNFEFLLEKVTLGDLIPPLKTTDYSSIVLNQLNCTTGHAFTLKGVVPTEEPSTTFTGDADFSGLNIGNLGISLNNLKVAATGSRQKGFHMEALISNLSLPVLGVINNAHFVFDSLTAVAYPKQVAAKAAAEAEAAAAKEAAEEAAKKAAETTQEEAPQGTAEEPAKKAAAATQEQAVKSSASAKEAAEATQEQASEVTEKQQVATTTPETEAAAEPLAKSARLLLEGDGTFSVPEIGLLTYTLTAEYAEKELKFTGDIKQEVHYKDIKLEKATLELNSVKRTVTITGNTSIYNIGLIGKLLIAPDVAEPKKQTVTFEAAVQKALVQPFINQPVPDFLKTITFTDVKGGIGATKGTKELTGSFFLTGKATILKTTAEATVRFVGAAQGGQRGVFVKAALPSNWKFSDNIANTKFFDTLPLQKAFFVVSSIDYTDPETDLDVKKGLSLYAQATLTGPLEPVQKLLGSTKQTITIYGVLDPVNPQNIVLGAKLSTGLPIKTATVSVGPLGLEIKGEPSISVIANIVVRPSDKDQPLKFVTRASVNPIELRFAGTMLGTWNNPFGIHGFSLSNLALQLGLNYAQLAATGLPSLFGLACQTNIGDKQLFLAAQADTTLKDMALRGTLNSLFLLDIVRLFAAPMGAKIPENNIPTIGFRNIDVKFAAKPVKIGEITIDQGLTLKGEADIITKKAVIDFNVDTSGITATGCMSKIDIGSFHITKSPKETPEAAARRSHVCAGLEQGPIVDIQLNTTAQSILISGRLELESIFTIDSFLILSKDGISFNFDTDIANGMFDAHVNGISSGSLKNPEFRLIIDLRQRFTDFVQQKVNESLTQAQQQIATNINNAQSQVQKIDAVIAQADQQIAKGQQDVDSAKAKLKAIDDAAAQSDKELDSARQKVAAAQQSLTSIQSQIDTVKAKVKPQQDKVDQLQQQIDSANRRVNDLEKEIDSAPWYRKADIGIANGAQIGGLKLEIGGLITAKGVATGVLQAAQGVGVGTLEMSRNAASLALRTAQAFVDNILKGTARATLLASKAAAEAVLSTAQQFLDKVVKGTARATLIAARESANGILEGAKKSGIAVVEGGKVVVKSLLNTVMIKEVRFDGSLRAITRGKLPDMLFKVVVLGNERTVTFGFDFNNSEGSAKAIGQSLAKLVTG